ncbi:MULTISPECIES: AraC family transcriptional regulator [Vagococcus]|uniref:Transcriptional regulator, AraC family n=1 Tax=Vagococcus fluvialis bH819 TaxID=1255619 RepID=A0A1X6WPK7_9ENTE|nr:MULTISPECIES: AraC family transcriptional regulator [Vagococcus]SLM85596.1 Transcriptional regulator, AraC family [Vagococcus fluvialis bH819]HCM89565.1 AraC family transcriptional regulator [Vagococcus sp.]
MNEIAAVLEYIENHLTTEIVMKDIEQLAQMSEYNFQKVFSILAGIPLGEYIRKRKLSCSLYDLKETDMKIIDIAFKYGYQSSESYSRAFQQYFQTSPSSARKNWNDLKIFPKLSIRVQIKGGTEMNYYMTRKPAFLVTGIKENYQTVSEGQEKIPQFWDTFNETKLFDQVINEKDPTTPNTVLGICLPGEGEAYNYLIGVRSREETTLPSLETITIPETDWVVFKAVGKVPEAIRKTYQEIYESFFPSTSYTQRNLPDFESYPLDLDPMSDNHVTEIWIPVK